MDEVVAEINNTFDRNVNQVYHLMDFDEVILDFAIKQVETLNERLKKHFDNPIYTADKTLQVLSKVREHDSLKINYSTIRNQCVVLLVSYFGTALRDLFTRCLYTAIRNDKSEELSRQRIKITLRELQKHEFDLSASIGEIVARNSDLSFQDMESIQRAFGIYFGSCPERDEDIHNIILAQACRHAIVHSGGIADKKLVKQLESAVQRSVKKGIREGEKIEFTPEEIHAIGASMLSYLNELRELLCASRTQQ